MAILTIAIPASIIQTNALILHDMRKNRMLYLSLTPGTEFARARNHSCMGEKEECFSGVLAMSLATQQ
jgi:hypothetical protein